MATSPAYSSALIEALRSAEQTGTASGVKLLPNSQNIGSKFDFVRAPRLQFTWPTDMGPMPSTAPPPPPPRPPAPPPPSGGGVLPPPMMGTMPVSMVVEPTVDDVATFIDDDGPTDTFVDDTAVADTTTVTPDITTTAEDGTGDMTAPPPPEIPSMLTGGRTLTPSVEVFDVPTSTTPAIPTNPKEDFELDRELGFVQQSDVYGPFESDNIENSAQGGAVTESFGNDYGNGVALTDQDLLEMGLFDMLTQERLTGTRRPRQEFYGYM